LCTMIDNAGQRSTSSPPGEEDVLTRLEIKQVWKLGRSYLKGVYAFRSVGVKEFKRMGLVG
jgi:hypothetical protein